MLNFFMAGPDMVRWELTALGPSGPYRLLILHAHGSIVEYFDDVTAALVRQHELEDLLTAARTMVRDTAEVWRAPESSGIH